MDKAINRQRILLQHLQPASSSYNKGHESTLFASSCLAGDRSTASGDDIVIVAAYRTAHCKSKRGGFKDTLPDELLSTVLKGIESLGAFTMLVQLKDMFQQQAKQERFETIKTLASCKMAQGSSVSVHVLKMKGYVDQLERLGFPISQEFATDFILNSAVIEKTNVNPIEVGDIVVGTVLAPGSQRAIECRMAAIYAGFPDIVPIRTVNRQCSSGLQAVADVAAYIKAGFYDIGIGAGVESMSTDQIGPIPISRVNSKVNKFAQAKDCLLPMGITSENVAQRFGVTRQEQDQAAVESHRRAALATSSGKFKDEIVPVYTKIVDPKTGEEKSVIISVDDGIRPNTNMADLAKLKPSFKKDGTTTAGTASQISDGASAVLLMKRSVALKKGLPILGVLRSFEVVGVDPAVMGIGPAVAIPKAVKAAGLELDNIDLFEINEAFGSQFVYCCKKLQLDPKKVNVNGGAIAFGHPLGSTGARCVATLLHEMKRRGKDTRFGVVSMCIGSGMGAAAVFERGD